MIASFHHDILIVVESSYHILRNFNRRPTCWPTFWGIDLKLPISNHRKDHNCQSNAVKNGYCSTSYDNLYSSNCKTILKFDPTPWSYQNLFKWLPNKFNSGMVYNISKTQTMKSFAYVRTSKYFPPWIDIEIGYIVMYSECLHRNLNRCTLSPWPSKF